MSRPCEPAGQIAILSGLDMRIGQIWGFRDGKVVRYEALPAWDEALEAAGLEE